MRAVIYCRVSTTEQAQNLSLSTQEKACREYCERQGYDVDQVFVDAGESAKTTDRPEFRRLLEHCRRGRGTLHAVIVYSLTRFSRNSVDHHAIASLLRGLGITLRSVTEPIDDSPSGRLMEGILAAIGQFDNDVKSERVTAGMKAAIERGRWVWPAPLGYLNANHRGRSGPSLVPDPDRAPAVRAAFEAYASGLAGKALLTHVRRLGLETRRKSPVTLSRLYDLLRHPVYTGRVRSRTWGLEQPGDFEPLVSEETFALVQLRFKLPDRATQIMTRHRNSRQFPLRRFVRCSCGRVLTGSASTGRNKQRYGFYHCLGCCRRVSKDTLERAFLALLDTLTPRPGYWRLLEVAVLDVWREECRTAGATQTTARRQVAVLEGKLQRLDEAYLYDRTVDQKTYHAQRDQLRESVALTKIDLAHAAVEEIDVEGMLAFAQHALTHASALWTAAASVDERQKLQWTLFPEGLALSQNLTGNGNIRGRRQRAASERLTGDSEKSGARIEHGIETFQQPLTCLRLFELQPRGKESGRLVDLPRPSWNQIATWLTGLSQVGHAA